MIGLDGPRVLICPVVWDVFQFVQSEVEKIAGSKPFQNIDWSAL